MYRNSVHLMSGQQHNQTSQHMQILHCVLYSLYIRAVVLCELDIIGGIGNNSRDSFKFAVFVQQRSGNRLGSFITKPIVRQALQNASQSLRNKTQNQAYYKCCTLLFLCVNDSESTFAPSSPIWFAVKLCRVSR